MMFPRASLMHQHIVCFQIIMQDTLVVHIFESFSNFIKKHGLLIFFKPPFFHSLMEGSTLPANAMELKEAEWLHLCTDTKKEWEILVVAEAYFPFVNGRCHF